MLTTRLAFALKQYPHFMSATVFVTLEEVHHVADCSCAHLTPREFT